MSGPPDRASPDRSRRHVRACANFMLQPGHAAEERQLLSFRELLIYSHACLPVSWDISGCVFLVDTFVREVSRYLHAT